MVPLSYEYLSIMERKEYGCEIIGKPKDLKEAFKIVKKMCGTYHFVYTGIAVKDCATGNVITDFAKTKVYFVKHQ